MDLRTFAGEALIYLAPVISLALLILVAYIGVWVRERFKWTRETRVVDSVLDALRSLIIKAEKQVVEELKAATEDGKLTDKEAEQIRKRVLLELEKQITKEQRKVLQGITSDISGWLEAKLEDILDQYRCEKEDVELKVEKLANPLSPVSSSEK